MDIKSKKGNKRSLSRVERTKTAVFHRKKLKTSKYDEAKEERERALHSAGSSEDEEIEDSDEGVIGDDDDDDDEVKVLLGNADEKDSDSESELQGNSGWADAMAKILHSKVMKKGSAVLAKGKTDGQISSKTKRKDFEIVKSGEANDEAPDENQPKNASSEKSDKELQADFNRRKMEKKNWDDLGRVKPDITERERERALQRIATKGVVQLFNAVRQRQKTLETKLSSAKTELAKEKVMKTITKGQFLDDLKNSTKSISVEEAKTKVVAKTQKKKSRNAEDDEDDEEDEEENNDEEQQPTWKILRDDFMMGAKMKDWDKESDSGSEVNDL